MCQTGANKRVRGIGSKVAWANNTRDRTLPISGFSGNQNHARGWAPPRRTQATECRERAGNRIVHLHRSTHKVVATLAADHGYTSTTHQRSRVILARHRQATVHTLTKPSRRIEEFCRLTINAVLAAADNQHRTIGQTRGGGVSQTSAHNCACGRAARDVPRDCADRRSRHCGTELQAATRAGVRLPG